MKKFIILAAVLLTMGTMGIANANAGVSFEISVGDKHHHGKGYGRGGHTERHYAPRYTPHHAPRYVVRECSHGHYGRGHGHYHGHRHGYVARGHCGHRY